MRPAALPEKGMISREAVVYTAIAAQPEFGAGWFKSPSKLRSISSE